MKLPILPRGPILSRERLHKMLSRRSRLLDRLGSAGLRFYLYRENAFFHPDFNGEHKILQMLEREGVSPRTIFDIGANEGRWSAHVRELWPNSQIHLFEPIPKIAIRLRERFADAASIHIHECAVGADDGTVHYHENIETSSHSFVSRAGKDEAAVRLISGVNAFREADIVDLDLCKIDAEGFDLEILHGFEPLLRAARIAFIQFEHHALAVSYQRSFGMTSHFLRELGYRVGKIFPDGLREVQYGMNDWSNQVGPNFLAASPAHSDIFEALISR